MPSKAETGRQPSGSRKIYVNLPVRDLATATPFYEALGAIRVPRFSNDIVSAMSWTDEIHFLLVQDSVFALMLPREAPDPRKQLASLIALSVSSPREVDAIACRAADAGGRADPCPTQQNEFSYLRSVEDPDGHIIEISGIDTGAMLSALQGDGMAERMN